MDDLEARARTHERTWGRRRAGVRERRWRLTVLPWTDGRGRKDASVSVWSTRNTSTGVGDPGGLGGVAIRYNIAGPGP
jgi:hypothetical protein